MKIHENIIIFGKNKINYYPIMIKRDKIKKTKNYGLGETMGGKKEKEIKNILNIKKIEYKLYCYNLIIEHINNNGKFEVISDDINNFTFIKADLIDKGE